MVKLLEETTYLLLWCAWQYNNENEPILNKEPIVYEETKAQIRNYKTQNSFSSNQTKN
jgi:hypothetical protein